MSSLLSTVILLDWLSHGGAIGSIQRTAGRLQPFFADHEARGCSELSNHGTHFTVDVEVGTPGQRFSVVADTGSNSLIVPSCVCRLTGKCRKEDRCFTGVNRSSSFRSVQVAQGTPQSIVLTFGSGQIEAAVVKDVAQVGAIEVFMQDGFLLMTDRALNINGEFEGILGLGVPQAAPNMTLAPAEGAALTAGNASSQKEMIAGILQRMGNGGNQTEQKTPAAVAKTSTSGMDEEEEEEDLESDGTEVSDGSEVDDGTNQDMVNKILRRMSESIRAGGAQDAADQAKSKETVVEISVGAVGKKSQGSGSDIPADVGALPIPDTGPRGFLEQANISRFSICFNDGSNGVLRLGTRPHPLAHGGIGKQHWGLDFRGITVGSNTSSSDALFCNQHPLKEGQQSRCGIIPDSGTTVITGPSDHVTALFEDICDRWPRCSANYSRLLKAEEKVQQVFKEKYGMNLFELDKMLSKADVLQLLLLDCNVWMKENGGLDEVPPVHFHIAGSNGTTQALTLKSKAYIMETVRANVTSNLQLLQDVGTTSGIANVSKLGNPDDKVCAAAFGVLDYNTQSNGPVWIMGTPIFYEFIVGYDTDANPPSISFTPQSEAPCGTCNSNLRLLELQEPKISLASETRPLGLRRVPGKPRMPNIDTTQPL